MRSLSKTPSPKKDRIYGSKVNPKGSASSEKSASSIKFDGKTIASLTTKLNEFKENNNSKKVSLSDLKAVYRRGLGAYSSSHRPTISGGKPNTRNAWAMARVNAFLRKASGGDYKKTYVQDDDLLKYDNGGEVGQDIKCRRCGWEWNTSQSEEFDKYVCHNCGFDNRMFYDKNPIGYVDGGKINSIVEDSKETGFLKFRKNAQFIQKHPELFLAKGGEAEERIKRNQKKYLGYDDLPQSPTEKVKGEDTLKGRYEYYRNHKELFGALENGGEIDDHNETYKKWRSLVNMSYGELKKFYDSKEGREAGLSQSEANKQGISNGRESARWVMKMKQTPKSEWTPTMWKWANKQISFISRMSGNEGGLYDDKGNKTRKHTSLLIWGHNPKKSSSMKYENGGGIDESMLFDRYGNKLEIGDRVKYDKVFYTFKYRIIGTIIEFKEESDRQIKNSSFGKIASKNLNIRAKVEVSEKLDNNYRKVKDFQKTTLIRLSNLNKIDEQGNDIIPNQNKMAKGGTTSKFKIYHETLSEALDEAERYIEANGYHFTEDRYFPDVTSGGIRYGETKSISRELGGKRKNTLLAQIYRMDSGRYELNMYFAYMSGGQTDATRTFVKDGAYKYILINVVRNNNFQKWANKKESLEKELEFIRSANPELASELKIFETNVDEQASFLTKKRVKSGTVYKKNYSVSKFELKKMEDGGVMDVRMEDTIQRMDDPNFADISMYMKGGKINWTEFYKDGGMNKTCEKFDKNGERKIDMKSIDELTFCVNKLPQTKEFHFHDGQYDADRKKLQKEIIYKIKKDLVCVESDKPIAILMGGSPASGKSTFLKKYRPYLLEEEILKVDADEIRSQLPEYKGFNATQTHLETKDIVNLLLSDRNIGIPCRFDLIYDGTMNNTKSYLPLIALLKSLGYRIYVVYIDNVPKDVIVNRALERYKRSGRFVPLEVIDDFFTRGKSALNEIKKEVDGYMIVDGKDSNYHVIEKGGMQLPKNRRYSKIGEPIKITTQDVVREYKRGGELNPDNPQLKNEVVHKSGKVGGMLVGNRHSEGGIKAINKSTGQPLEMEGGEVVITRNAVSDDKKRMFEGKMMTNKEILSKINESGGGVSFAKGGNVKKKDDCGCGGYESGGNVKDMKSQYPKDFKKGVREETREHSDTFMDLKRNKISLKQAAEKVVAKHLSEKPNYYQNYKHGGYLTFADKQIPSFNEFLKGQHMVSSPFVGESTMYSVHENAESNDHKFHRVDDKKAKPISNLLAYETYLYDNFGILFSQLPIQVQNALTLGKQALIDNYINS